MFREYRYAILLVLGVSTAIGCSSQPTLQCEAIQDRPIDGVSISQARYRPGEAGLPEFCQVQGTIDPQIGFEARLPMRAWNGKFFQAGCGGYCGSVLADKPGLSNTINVALRRGYAAITTDGGHKGGPGDAAWAKDNPEAVVVYAHKAIPLTYRAGIGLVQRLYKRAPDKAYFSGCSNGGRMAAMAAQRYPTLFDGIIGGSGVLDLATSGGVYGSWVVQANSDPHGERVLTQASFAHKLPLLETTVRQQCDKADGSEDDLISTPRQCVVDIHALPACTETSNEHCFTAEERRVLAAWYQGPRDSTGTQLFPGMPPGSERFWAVWFLDTPDRVAIGNGLGGDYAKYLGFGEATPSDYSVHDFEFDRDPPKLAKVGRLVNATDPDLRQFRDSGGKFIMWHGWADPLVVPDQSVSYYEATAAELGGFKQLQSFFRLFMVPGHGHCWEIPATAPDLFDPLDALEAWVEKGEPPDQIIARRPPNDANAAPAAALCPHPQTAVQLDSESTIGPGICRKQRTD